MRELTETVSEKITNQYSDYSDLEYSKRSKRFLYVLIGAVVLFILITSLFVLIPKEKLEKPECGNRRCDIGENCYECPFDCKCEEGYYCSPETRKCVLAICGNNKCEPGENSENCCNDCGCRISGEICNKITHKCEIPSSGVSDDLAKKLVEDYLKEKGISGYEIVVGNDTIHEGKPAKIVYVYPHTQKDWRDTLYFVVTADGNVRLLGIPI